MEAVIPNETITTEAGENIEPIVEVELSTTEQWAKDNTHENGKFFGRFDTMEEGMDFYKQQEITHTNKMREFKDVEKGKVEAETIAQETQEAATNKANALIDIGSRLSDNGMVMTDEMITEIDDSGLTVAEAKVQAYESKAINEATYQVLGGKENYDVAMEYATTIFDENQQKGMMDSIRNNYVSKEFRELAMLGLQSKMNSGEQVAQPRVTGVSPSAVVNKGYDTIQAYNAGRKAASTNPALRAKHEAMSNASKELIGF